MRCLLEGVEVLARRRMIDPNFWRSQDVKKLTIRQRLLAIGLFSLADDDGRGIADPPYVRAVVFPYDDFTSKEIEEDLKAIEKQLSIVFYEVDGNRYYAWKNWEKWQTVNKPQKSVLPPPPHKSEEGENNTNSVNDSVNDSGNGSGNESMNDSGKEEGNKEGKEEGNKCTRKERKGKEGKGTGGEELFTTPSPSPSSSLPEHTQTEREILKELKAVPGYPFDFSQDLDYVRNLMVEFPSLDMLAEVKKWRTYKRDKPLKPKSNPRLQFRNWCEKAVQWQKGVKLNEQHCRSSQGAPDTDTGKGVNFNEFLWRGKET